jgi:Putative restriction endonuclease
MDYSDCEVALPECHIVKRKEMKLFCFFLDVFIAGLRSATVVFAPISYVSPQNRSKFGPIYQEPLAPDIAVIKGVAFRRTRSWRVGKSGPAPQVVFEIASKETWNKDVKEKPDRYAQMGVQEYFTYDPNDPPLHRKPASRLRGWRLDPLTHQMRELSLRPDGTLWSMHLESFLVPDGPYLHLADQYGQRRLTKAEAEVAARQVADRQTS